MKALMERRFGTLNVFLKKIRRRFGLGGSNFSEPRIIKVAVDVSEVIFWLTDGRAVRSPLALYPTLLKAADQDRQQFTVSARGLGVHWPNLDFDLSLEGMLAGRGEYQRPKGTPMTPTGNFRDYRDRDRINVHEDYEVRYWTKELGVTPEKLKQTVEKVGVMATHVRKALGK
jgi:hypothetical protein